MAQVIGVLLTLYTRSLCVIFDLYDTVILHVFFCEIEGGGDDELSLRFIVLLLHGLSCAFIVMCGVDELVYGSFFSSYTISLVFYSDE